MKYSILSINKGSCNQGNRLIEFALKALLGLPDPAVELSMFVIPNEDEIYKINKTDFLLLPGSTILAGDSGQSLAMACLQKVKIPILAVGCSGWEPYYSYQPEYLKYIQEPIGVRDPHALGYCEKHGKKAWLVGCPTLFLPPLHFSTKGFSIVGFSRYDHQWQYDLLKRIPGNIVCSVQEPSAECHLARSLSLNSFDYSNPVAVMNHYAECKAVYTGRIHGALPAISQGKKVCFFGKPEDSRYSLLTYLGIKIIPIGISNPDLELQEANKFKIEGLQKNFYDWAKEFRFT